MRAAVALVALVALAAEARADSSVPAPPRAPSPPSPWSTGRCAERLERALAGAGPKDEFAAGTVSVDGATVSFRYLAKAVHYTAQVKVDPKGRLKPGEKSEWAGMRTWVQGGPPQLGFTRRRNGLVGDVDAEGDSADRFRALFEPAIDDCLAKGLDRSGGYRLEGEVLSDACSGRVVLAARNLTLSESSLTADVVNRTYAVVRSGEVVTATGSFPNRQCPGAPLVEDWRLEPAGEGVLAGTLRSSWSLPPSCEVRCDVVFRVRAVPRP